MRTFFAILLLTVIFFLPVSALELEKIMRDNSFIGSEPNEIRWSPDGRFIYFNWQGRQDKAAQLYTYDSKTRVLSVVPEERLDEVMPLEGEWDNTRTRILYTRRTTLFCYDVRRGRGEPLLDCGEPLHSYTWNRAGSGVYFSTNQGIYFMSLGKPYFHQVVRFQRGPAGKPEKPDAVQAYLAQEEGKLIRNFDAPPEMPGRRVGRIRIPRIPRKGAPGAAVVVPLEEEEQVGSFSLSADESQVALTILRFSLQGGGQATQIPHFVNPSAYTTLESSRGKAGHNYNFQSRALLVTLADGGQKPVTAQRANGRVQAVYFAPNGALFAQISGEDFHDYWLVALKRDGSEEREIYHLHDDAWLENRPTPVPIPGASAVLLVAEHNDHLRLLRIQADGKVEALTGDYEVGDFSLTPDGKKVVYFSSQGHPGLQHTWVLDLASGKSTPLTSGQGWFKAWPAPDFRKLAVVQSDSVTPPELYLYEGTKRTVITRSPAEEFFSFPLQRPEIVTFKASDGVEVRARILRPEKRNGAAVIFIHGAGYLQDAHLGWSDYWREFLFGNLLREKGYVFFDIDYRGSAGYGRDFRTGIFTRMGGRDLDDIIDGIAYLTAHEGVDGKRIAAFGGSYGGFLTLMGLFKYPDTFACGAALRPVTDWAHYGGYYANPILGGKPQDVPEHFRRSSPIYFAEGLKKPLLILHGMIDDNVHFQDSVRLAERLIELRKTNWWLQGYPVERHTFRYAESWYDEYRRILEMIETYLK